MRPVMPLVQHLGTARLQAMKLPPVK